ncbi:hypothetical protein [Curtobacterium aurantiacum]|uniref:hypothetical protein n=1 Tax=Curtobacterium aurantiacum TaxID=3236919 RepID=UPI001BDF0C94|nr:hypothetical protein [Curtobacterium flaccumfaciens]MBT1679783.1 hypothetical protein [Curtobacterium flaccumfaciens pv. flaccumfaciens]
MISTSSLQELPDPALIESAASELKAFGTSVVDRMALVSTAWARLSTADVYETPEREVVLSAMQAPSTIAAMVQQNAHWAAKQLETYATAVSGLVARRASILTAIHASNEASRKAAAEPAPSSSGEPAPTPSPSPGADPSTAPSLVRDEIDSFNQQAAQADQDCADALCKLEKYSENQVQVIANALGGGGAAGTAFGLGTAVSQEAMERWRRLIVVPASSVKVKLTIPEADHLVLGYPVWKGADGSVLADPPLPPELKLTGPTSSHGFFVPDKDASPGAVPGWAKAGGKALGWAGGIVTVYAAGNEQWTKDMKDHPEWDTSRRLESATENAVIVGGFSLVLGGFGAMVGSTVGATLGAAAGAAAGTVTLPIVGTIGLGAVGGVVGGVAGGAFVGYAMGDFGEDLGKNVKSDVYEGSAAQDTFHQAWTWSSDVVEGAWEKVFG